VDRVLELERDVTEKWTQKKASDGQEAIDYLQGAGKFADREQFPLPCLVLLDLKLPYVMGLDVLKWIREQFGAGLAVVILTASGQDEDIAAAYRLGANAFLTKPTEANKLQDMVRAIKDFWLTHSTLPEESYREPVATPAQSRILDPGAKSLPGINGTVREEWRPMVSRQTSEANHPISYRTVFREGLRLL
jgi:CheY-like chemotaxis protein